MSPISLNDLPNDAPEVSQVDFDNYADPTAFPPPVPEGTYNMKTTKMDLESYENGVLTYVATHEAYDRNTGEKVGTITFDRISTKTIQRDGRPASAAADQLRAMGISDRPTSIRNWGELLESTKAACDQGEVWVGIIQWNGYCSHKDTEFETVKGEGNKVLQVQPPPHAAPFVPRGEKKWPMEGENGNAHRSAVVACPTCKQDVQARANIALWGRVPKRG